MVFGAYTNIGAENGTRTRDPNLGKVMLYQLSYFRNCLFPVESTPATLHQFLAKVRGICYSRGKVMLYQLSYFRKRT